MEGVLHDQPFAHYQPSHVQSRPFPVSRTSKDYQTRSRATSLPRNHIVIGIDFGTTYVDTENYLHVLTRTRYSGRKELQRLSKRAVDVTADYLRKLWDFTLANIRAKQPNVIEGLPIRIVLSVPALWPNTAVDRMIRATEQAGLMSRRAGGLETRLVFIAQRSSQTSRKNSLHRSITT